jgi:hypothetical protein
VAIQRLDNTVVILHHCAVVTQVDVAMVLELNLHKMTLPELRQYVDGKCGEHGTVKNISVRLYPPALGQDRPFAVVEMSSPEENLRLRNTIGDGYFAGGVCINLVHKV